MADITATAQETGLLGHVMELPVIANKLLDEFGKGRTGLIPLATVHDCPQLSFWTCVDRVDKREPIKVAGACRDLEGLADMCCEISFLKIRVGFVQIIPHCHNRVVVVAKPPYKFNRQ
ncbi:hypothetical protein [Stenotrophomonas sp.]|uniref:hypothetical protein n=1 Tax=Stenotrophomonas sp. TaxID=69392 RepID=UPI0028A82236|nr:hypothetical protein [Stenotrophomonas sp.]